MTVAYIGPGGGFAVSFSLLTLLIVAATIVLAPVVIPASVLWRAFGRKARCRRGFKKVVVLGLDGLDPGIVRGLMQQGRLPSMAALAQAGHFGDLQTVAPAITPAAWSSFMTGVDPSRHAIFDFVSRDPRTYLPRLSASDVTAPARHLRIGRRRIPLSPPRVRMLRRGTPFWRALGRHGLEVTVLRVPVTFPPERFRGRLLSGMFVPDLEGGQGTFTVYAAADRRDGERGGRFVRLEFTGDEARASIAGPEHPFLPGVTLHAPMVVRRRAGGVGVRVEVGRETVDLKAQEFSDWVPVRFRAFPLTVVGMVRFHLARGGDDVALYMTPVQIHPETAAMRISQPHFFANYLAKGAGPFATLGLAEDTSALNSAVLDDAAFLRQAWDIFAERKAMFLRTLEQKVDDVTVCVFDTPDRIQHMFWRYREADHPARRDGDAREGPARDGDEIDRMVEEMDRLVGETVRRLPAGALLLVMSDHGFTGFRRGVNLNAWLRERGYLHLLPGAAGDGDWMEGVDWSKTRAYAMGLSGLFVNLRGREGRGIVGEGPELDQLLDELRSGLEALRDEGRDGAPRAVRRAFVTRRDWSGPYRVDGPDVIVGYERGYRCSWACANGQVAGPVFSDNTRPWSGDHCVDPALVPGVLLASAPLARAEASILDVAPTILDLFGVPPEAPMQGTSLLVAAGEGK